MTSLSHSLEQEGEVGRQSGCARVHRVGACGMCRTRKSRAVCG